MNNEDEHAMVVKIADRLSEGKSAGEISLCEITANALRLTHRIQDDSQVKRKTFEVVRRLLKHGLRPGNFKVYETSEVELWPETDADKIIDRMSREWPTQGDPALNEICWLFDTADTEN